MTQIVLKNGYLVKGGARKQGGRKSKKRKKAEQFIPLPGYPQHTFTNVELVEFICPMNVTFHVHNVSTDGNCFFYSFLRAVQSKEILCRFKNNNFDLRQYYRPNGATYAPTDIYKGIYHNTLYKYVGSDIEERFQSVMVKKDEYQAGKDLRELLKVEFRRINQIRKKEIKSKKQDPSPGTCTRDFITTMNNMVRNFAGDDIFREFQNDLNRINQWMDTGSGLLQTLIYCIFNIRVRVFMSETRSENHPSGKWHEMFKDVNPNDPNVVNLWFGGSHYQFMRPMSTAQPMAPTNQNNNVKQSSNSKPVMDLTEDDIQIQKAMEHSLKKSDYDINLQKALDVSLEDQTTASESASVLSDDLQQLVDDNLLTETQAIQMMQNT